MPYYPLIDGFHLTEGDYLNYQHDACHIKPIEGNLNTAPQSFAMAKNHELFQNLTKAMLKIHIDGRVNEMFQRYEKFSCQRLKPQQG